MQIYTRKELPNQLYEVQGPDGKVIKNHNGKPYPPLSENVSRNLLTDFNAIVVKHYAATIEDENSQEAFENLISRVTGEELRRSFGYCLLSSLIEYQNDEIDVDIEVEMQIQWDRLFRMNVMPNGGELEYNATKKARDFFEHKWQNFGLNYYQSFEEMEANEVKFVSEELVNTVRGLVDKLTFSHKIAVDILYQFFDCFSITIPILWVSGKINDEDFIKAYYALEFGININEIDKDAYEEPRFLMNRLLCFKTILWAYQWDDKSLPAI